MSKLTILAAAATAMAVVGLAGCAARSAPIAKPVVVDEPWVASARSVGQAVPLKLLSVLTAAIDQSGAAGAIDVCKEQAPRLAQAASQETGWQVRRVSLRNRNPKAVPDAWEQQTLQWFEQQQAAGVAAAQLERAEVVMENGQPTRRYMRALPTAKLCLQCHGAANDLGPGVAARLAALYPADRGTGFSEGQLRGAMTLKQAVR